MPESSQSAPASGAEAAREIIACAERALAEPSARIELHREFRYLQAEWPRPRGWRGNVLALAVKTAKLLISAGWRLATHRLETTRGLEFGHMVGEGIAEPARRRYMIDFGSFSQPSARAKPFPGTTGPRVRCAL